MAVDFAKVLGEGGKPLLDLLSFAVFSVRPDGLFVFLAREYRVRPTPTAAITIFDLFCAPGSPARLSAEAALSPTDWSLNSALAPVRAGIARAAAPPPAPLPDDPPWQPPAIPLPPIYLFDGLAERLLKDPDGQVAALAAEFDPEQGPFKSLPNGKLSGTQRAFVEQTWRRRIQPALLTAGFWRVATVGQA